MARHGNAKARTAKRPTIMAAAGSSPHQLSMQQQARNTEIHGRLWSNNNLRHKAVRFVSAGEVQRSEFENANGKDQESQSQSQSERPYEEPEADIQKPSTPPEVPQESLFYFDSTGQTTPATGFPNPTIPFKSLDSDDTSEDEVVFTGRNNNSRPVVIETDGDELRKMLERTASQQPTVTGAPEMEQITTQVDQTNISQSPAAPHVAREPLSPEANDPLADYIANIDHDYYDEADEELPSHQEIAIRNGMDVDPALGGSGLSDSSSTDDIEAVPTGVARRHGRARADQPEELDVQNSIDVLSKMHLDAEPNRTPGPDDGSEEFELSDEAGTDSEEEEEDIELLEAMAIEYSAQHKKGGPRRKRSFPSASAFADALEADPYYGFDIMDFDRPSLQQRGKRKKPPALELMLSDSDMESHLQEVWQSDRKKKKDKKKEREELRSQGLLGRNPGDPDLKIKYSKGMNVEELITEIRTFLLSSRTSLSLPPMTKHRRKAIHELANIVNLKSQSRGNGPARFTMLLKTSRTPGYTRKTISKVDSLLSGRKLNRRVFQSWGSDATKPTKIRSKRGAVGGAVSYMEGEVVGASAPEIGTENRGRAMLEKMGWSSGTALGASNNKGILQPVAHVVKNSRAGLG